MEQELIIPVRFDHKNASADLKAVEKSGKAAGDATARGFKDASAGAKQAGDAAKGFNNELAGILKAQMGFSAFRQLAGAIGQEFKRSADYAREMAQQFADVRQAIIQVAALRGEQPTNQFTKEQAQQAAKVGLTAQQWTKAQEAFLNPAGAQIGNQPGAKMTDAQAQEFEARVAKLTASKLGGENAGMGMGLAGSILEQSKGPLTPQQAMEQFNPAFEVAQKGRIDLRRAPSIISQIMAHGVSATQAATIANVVAPVAPGEEVTSAEGAFRAIEEMRVNGKGEQFGVTDKMGQYEAFKAFGKNISEREQALRAQGKNDNEIEVEIARQLKEADVAAEIRERRGLVRGIARQGIGLGGFKTFEDVAAQTGKNYDLEAVRKFEESDEGRAARNRATADLAKNMQGFIRQDAKEELDKAAAEADRRGAHAESRLQNLQRGAIGTFTGVSAQDQINNEIAIGTLRSRAAFGYGIKGDSEGQFQIDRQGRVSTADVASRPQESINAEIRELRRLIAEQTQIMREDQQRNANRPLVVAPAAPPGR